jgi:glycosyltransferase involved in cell wall biosynthesis
MCGGVEMFLLRLCPHLRARGYDVEVLTTEERGEWFERMAAEVPTSHVEGCGRFPRASHPLRVGAWLARARYDAVLLNGDEMAQQSLTMLPDRVVALPVIHSDSETTYRLNFANADAWNALVAVGPRIADRARAQFPARPVVEILHGVPLPEPAALAGRYPAPRDELRIIFVGRIVQHVKNVLLLPEALRRCREAGVNARLTVAGDGPDLPLLRSRIHELSLAEHVRFVGAVPPEEVYRLLLDHHVLLLPSFFEGFGLAPLEAQACGCVPVASRLEGVTTPAMEEGKTGRLVAVGDVAGFADALTELGRDPEHWTTMSAAARAFAAERFSLERMTDDYARLIDAAVAGRYPLPRSRRGRLPVDPSMYWRQCVPSWVRAAGRKVLGR